MLAVFDRAVAKCPEDLKVPAEEGSGSGTAVGTLMQAFTASREGAVSVSLGTSGAIGFSSSGNTSLLTPRYFGAIDDIFCLFKGQISNMVALKQQYGLGKAANEVTIIIEAYRTLRDRGPFPASEVVRDLNGLFAFVLFDASLRSTFVAADADGGVQLFWGSGPEDHLIFSDDAELIKKGCGNSFAPFPVGCFFTSTGGLRSFEHPLNEMKAVPRVDSKGDVCGANFQVDSQSKIDSPIPRVGSAANWSSHF